MKRTNLVLDADLLEEATRLSGEKTYSRAVSRALEDFVRLAKARKLHLLAGSGLWEGNLAALRDDDLMLADSQPMARRQKLKE